MFCFNSDYLEGAHPAVLQKLIDTNMMQLQGYGNDEITAEAKDLIRKACGCPDADVFFFPGGTPSNVTIIDSLLNTYDGMISAETGHINCHECGAVEYTGHKVLPLPQHDGKIDAAELRQYIKDIYDNETWDHMVQPGGVYVSHPTEFGTLYKKSELEEIASVCREYGIPLYMDGARLGYGLASAESDLTLKDIANICDAFYIGGTKVGALCGEAVVFPKGNADRKFFTVMKQRCNILAKGRLTGAQFLALFEDGLYFRIGKQAVDMALRLAEILRAHGIEPYVESPTNMQFFIMDNALISRLRKKVNFDVTEKYDEKRSIVRFVCSWATKSENIDEFEAALLSVI